MTCPQEELLQKSLGFKALYDEYGDREGQPFRIIRELTKEEIGPDHEEVGRMWLIIFDDGEEAHAFPEEIFN